MGVSGGTNLPMAWRGGGRSHEKLGCDIEPAYHPVCENSTNPILEMHCQIKYIKYQNLLILVYV